MLVLNKKKEGFDHWKEKKNGGWSGRLVCKNGNLNYKELDFVSTNHLKRRRVLLWFPNLFLLSIYKLALASRSSSKTERKRLKTQIQKKERERQGEDRERWGLIWFGFYFLYPSSLCSQPLRRALFAITSLTWVCKYPRKACHLNISMLIAAYIWT